MKRAESRPWATMLALLAACFATVVGVIAGLDPDVVLRRALEAGLAAGLIWTVGRLVFVTVLDANQR